MDYLTRDDAPFSPELWERIDTAVTQNARQSLCARRFLSLHGPLGAGAAVADIDTPACEEMLEDGIATIQGRSTVQIPQLYEDFWILWRDMAAAERDGVPLDISAAAAAGQNIAWREEEMVFYGVKALGVEGLVTAAGANKQKRGDWQKDETAFADISAAISTLLSAGKTGRHTLLLSQDLFTQLQRIQPGTGLLESERIAKLLDGRLYHSPVLLPKTAALLCAQPQYMDIVVGQDIKTAYTEAVDLNHHLRVLETALVRVKDPKAIVLFA